MLVLLSTIGIARASQPEPDQMLIERGRYLAQAGDCVACHTSTAKGAAPFAGGLKMAVPMLGSIFATNITPDPETGIGRYTVQDFARAVREGVAKDGHNLYPAMPYPSYSKVSDEDISALYAYFMHGVKPVKQANLAPEIPKLLQMRWPLKLWNLVFLDTERFKPIPENSVEWNRGAYLVQGLGHCGTCHTPRGIGLQEKALDQRGSAYLSGAELGGWFASNLTSNPITGIGTWSAQDIVDFLKTGANSHATAFGPMTEVINNSAQWMTDQDLAAMAVYLKSLAAAGTPIPQHGPVDPKVMAHGAQVYQNYCVSCHLPNGKGTAPWLSPLAGNPNVLEGNPVSLINVTLNGTEALVIDGVPAPYPMPAHRLALTDAQIADALTFTRNSWGNQAPAVTARDVKTLREQTGHDK
ncbi:alcohol dehydrogenase [Ralstonia insidiosa]|uniref:Alcohol dehydrogenase n=2 Tax=Ralstonia insidiosa TaxID=190721 RepID=A0A191ZZN3_9RALS|nr:alcohol dehydrogenase [Ralstonia insidiosa]